MSMGWRDGKGRRGGGEGGVVVAELDKLTNEESEGEAH